jgi:hypothetical protein
VRPQLGPISRHQSNAPRLGARQTAGEVAVLVDNEPRSRRYLDAVSRLDAGADLTPAQFQEIIDELHHEFTQRWASLPLGLVSRCYLGHPFEVHTLAPDGGILEHYRIGQPMPGPLEGARKHGLSDLYVAVEVYSNRLVCIRADGTTVTLGGDGP